MRKRETSRRQSCLRLYVLTGVEKLQASSCKLEASTYELPGTSRKPPSVPSLARPQFTIGLTTLPVPVLGHYKGEPGKNKTAQALGVLVHGKTRDGRYLWMAVVGVGISSETTGDAQQLAAGRTCTARPDCDP